MTKFDMLQYCIPRKQSAEFSTTPSPWFSNKGRFQASRNTLIFEYAETQWSCYLHMQRIFNTNLHERAPRRPRNIKKTASSWSTSSSAVDNSELVKISCTCLRLLSPYFFSPSAADRMTLAVLLRGECDCSCTTHVIRLYDLPVKSVTRLVCVTS